MEAFEAVPAALRIKRNWCVHRADGDKAKVPHAIGGYKLQWSIPANWINFIEAKKAYLEGLSLPEGHKCRFDGLGFFISREKDSKLDIYAVDLDHCIEAGEIAPWAKEVLAKLNSYSEVSPSGTGIHIFVKGFLPEGSKNTNDQMKDKNRVEVFIDKHHITITGNRLLEYPATIEDRSEAIQKLYNEVMEVKREKKEAKKQSRLKTKKIIYDGKAEAKKKYVTKAIEDEISILKGTAKGDRNNQLNRSAFAIGQFVGAHYISRAEAERELSRGARACGMDESEDGIEATIQSGLDDGESNPREIPEPEEKIPLPQITLTCDKVKPETIQSEAPKKEAIANVLVKLAIKNSLEIWHTPDDEGYITVPINSHREHYKLTSKAVRTWLGRLGHELMEKVVSGTAIRDAINVLEGKAIYDGKEYELHVRKAQLGNKIYVDLGDDRWRAVEISEDGWKIIEDCPVRFKRSKNMLPLPIPERGGEIDVLKGLINAQTEENWILVLAWLTQAFWCRGPYAHLYLRGTQGTAKSYMMQTLKAISDPSAAIKRRLPKSERDAAIAIGSEAISCFDNMSGIDDSMADLWCVASTGGVSTQRALFTDDEEAVINLKCPIIANGIADLGQRGDLLDRTIVIDLEPIPESERKTEKEMQAAIDSNRAKLFGCLLDITVTGLNNIDSIELENPPRMADFAQWASACLGDAASRFMEIYIGSREDLKMDLVETNDFPRAVLAFAKDLDVVWMGTASTLLEELNTKMHVIKGYEPSDWPKTANLLGSELRRHIPDLESSGVFIKFSKSHKKARGITIWYKPEEDKNCPPKIDSKDKEDKEDNSFLKLKGIREKKEEKEEIRRNLEKYTGIPQSLSPRPPSPRGSTDSDLQNSSEGTALSPPEKAKVWEDVVYLLTHAPCKTNGRIGFLPQHLSEKSKISIPKLGEYLMQKGFTKGKIEASGLEVWWASEKALKAMGIEVA